MTTYQSSYESGQKPFLPDARRGQWNHPNDFIYIAIGLVFRLDTFHLPVYQFKQLGLFSIVPYVLCAVFYVVPVLLIQSFLGQFSSSGFISIFRIAPISKGIGYISLALNYVTLLYYTAYVNAPLLFLFYSFFPSLPWSDGFNADANSMNNTKGSSADFYRENFADFMSEEKSFSWKLLATNLITWSSILLISNKFFTTEKLGTILRYLVLVGAVCLSLILTRLLFLPEVVELFTDVKVPTSSNFLFSFMSVMVNIVTSFGMGWGSIVTLASFNKFNTNIVRSSWLICFGQILVLFAFNVITVIIDQRFLDKFPHGSSLFLNGFGSYWELYLIGGSAVASLELPNFWSILLYGMLFIVGIIVMVTQLHVILISVFDDFEVLRKHRTLTVYALIASGALFSLYSSTHHGFNTFVVLAIDTFFTQILLNILVLIVVLWIYGREKFQRDYEFMLKQQMSTWRVNFYRYVTTSCLLMILLCAFMTMILGHAFITEFYLLMSLIISGLPWIFVPACAMFFMLQTSGSSKARFKRLCRPIDWYPVDASDRNRYEETIGNSNTTHVLYEVSDDLI